MEAITELLEDGNATIEPISPSQRGQLAAHLLQAAGPGNARVIRTVSVKGGGRAFLVPAAVAYAAGLVPDAADGSAADESETKPPAKKAPAKKAAPAKTSSAEAKADVE
ncbi:hypothetical protein [Nocardia abscessus]|uniref:hypothetical protein n=1 Tax=Nocardia abscessus TaxID=120957 RepID=UPI002458C57D|nr:hypothetical protein [Nocardia abscessus]